MITLGGLVQFIGLENTREVVEMIDEISDAIGYEGE